MTGAEPAPRPWGASARLTEIQDAEARSSLSPPPLSSCDPRLSRHEPRRSMNPGRSQRQPGGTDCDVRAPRLGVVASNGAGQSTSSTWSRMPSAGRHGHLLDQRATRSVHSVISPILNSTITSAIRLSTEYASDRQICRLWAFSFDAKAGR